MTRPLFEGPLQPFGAGVLAADDVRPVVDLPTLLQAERLEALLSGLYGPSLLLEHRPVLVSQWAKYGFMQLINPVLVAALAHRWHWPLHLHQVALALDDRGIPQGVKFLAEGAVLNSEPNDPLQPFASLLDDLLTPLIAQLSAYGGVARSVLWSSAGDVVETCLARLDDRIAQGGWALLKQARRADGRRNPLYQTVIYNPLRQRRACCLSHRVAWVGRCEHCPLPV